MTDPSSLTHEQAIRYFLSTVGPELAACDTLSAAISRFAEFYANTRVEGAAFENDDDGFCIETGCFTKIAFPEPGDYRLRGDDVDTSDDTKFLQVSIRRTIHPSGALPEGSEFDDDAFDMYFESFFDELDDDSVYGIVQCFDVTSLSRELEDATAIAPLEDLVRRSPFSTAYAVGGAG